MGKRNSRQLKRDIPLALIRSVMWILTIYFTSMAISDNFLDLVVIYVMYSAIAEVVYARKYSGVYIKPYPWLLVSHIVYFAIVLCIMVFGKSAKELVRLIASEKDVIVARYVLIVLLAIIVAWDAYNYYFDCKKREILIRKSKVKKLKKMVKKQERNASFDFPFGIVIRDDTFSLPTTFSKAKYPVVDMIVFDWDVVGKNFYFKEWLHEEDYKEEKIWSRFKYSANFYIMVIDCSKYALEKFKKIMEDLYLLNHSMESRPVYIYLINANDLAEDYLSKITWLNELTIYRVKDVSEINLDDVIKHYNVHNAGQMVQSREIYKSINWLLDNPEVTGDYRPDNYHIIGFFHNMFMPFNKNIAVLSSFDYLDMVLRYVILYLIKKHNLPYLEKINGFDIEDICQLIDENVQETDKIYKNVKSTVKVDKTIRKAFDDIEKIYPVEIEGDEIGFRSLAKLLDYLRNRSRGHGSIQEGIAEKLWEPMFILLTLLSQILCVESFHIDTRGKNVTVGYDEEKIQLGEYATVSDRQVCLLYSKDEKKKSYINYVRGEISIPEVYSVELSQ